MTELPNENHRRSLWRGDPDSPPDHRTGRRLLAALSAGVRADGGFGRATAGSAYLLGQVINKAYVDKNVRGIAILSGVTVLIFIVRVRRPTAIP